MAETSPTQPIHVALVSTYPPRACGIGTFSRDLRDSLLRARPGSTVDVAAIVTETKSQRPEVAVQIRQQIRGDYVAAARSLNQRNVEAVVLEHEYGIFGGADGEYVLTLASHIQAPLFVTLHTVISQPSPHQAEVLTALCKLATVVTVFTETAKRMIVASGVAAASQIKVVPHGAPDILTDGAKNTQSTPPSLLQEAKRRCILSTFGLISSGKGIEVAIAALPKIIEDHPDVLYVVAGQTHPEVVKRDGEEYRLGLERLASDLGVRDHVRFMDRFLTIEELATMLASTTLYLTPYHSREQIVSGALTFAVAAGCPAVSTPYFYAEDLLSDGAGIIVPFDDADAMADAVNDLLGNPKKLAEARKQAEAVGSHLSWSEVGRHMAGLLEEAPHSIPANVPPDDQVRSLPRPRLDHLFTLVDDVGIIQHADGVLPARISGYCTDDVARLGLVALSLRGMTGEAAYDRLLTLSLSFLQHAWSANPGGMRNFMSYDRRWLDEPHLGDHFGRAVWLIGEVLGGEEPSSISVPTRRLLDEFLPAISSLRSLRAAAFAIIGLARVADPRPGEQTVLRQLVDFVVDSYHKNTQGDWCWFEPVLAYDNARLPQALLIAGGHLQDEELISIALRSLEWYGQQVDVDGPYVRLIGHKLLRPGEQSPGEGDEQPLDVAALVEAQVEAYRVTGETKYAERASRTFEWFLGRNRLNIPVYDFTTGGCHDGLGVETVNHNEGAESTLAFLQALLIMDGAGLQTSLPERDTVARSEYPD